MASGDGKALDQLEFKRLATSTGRIDTWEKLHGLLPPEELAWLLGTLNQVDPPERIQELKVLESTQEELGAGFYGMLPEQIPDNLPAPAENGELFDSALALAKIRQANIDAATGAFTTYAFGFTGARLPSADEVTVPTNWDLEVDTDSMLSLIEVLGNPETTLDQARGVARLPAFVEMMTHRRELGYVPEPLIDEAGFAWCIQQAASDDPIHRLWMWLHPHNLFDLADVRTNLDAYRQLLTELNQGAETLARIILGRISSYAPSDVPFQDRLSFAIGWAISGWATRHTGGINLEHFKDDFERLLGTLTHETFHRLQLNLCPAHPAEESGEFESITGYPLGDPTHEALYRAMAYIALEGTATYVGSADVDADWAADATPALEILAMIEQAEDPADVDGLLNEGLKSNGPFYGFGALLSDAIVQANGTQALGRTLQAGGPAFVLGGLRLSSVDVNEKLAEALAAVSSAFDTARG